MTIFERIDTLCKAQNTTVNALCAALNISNGNQATWKKGNIKIIHLLEICNYLQVTADFILGRDDKKISPVIETEDEMRYRLSQLSADELAEVDLYLQFLEYKRSL